jgi:hypothetical protein
MIQAPAPTEYDRYYATYIDPVANEDVLGQLEAQAQATPRFLATIPESRASFRYAPGKWSIRDIIGHLADSERIFAYRALRIARHDKTPLPSFDENDYANVAGFDRRSLADVSAEFASVRAGTLTLFRSMDAETLALTGTAGGKPISVRALAFIILGHERHHLKVIKAKYLSEAK